MAAKKRTHLSCDPEHDFNKFYTEDVYKSHHYKKRFLLCYTQYDLNAPARDTTEDETLTYRQAKFKLYDLSSYKSDLNSEFMKNSNNLFVRRNKKQKVTNSDLNSTEVFNERRKKIDKSEKELQNDLGKSTGHISSRRRSACNSPVEARVQGDARDITEVPLNLIINENRLQSDDVNRQLLAKFETPPEELSREIKLMDEETTVLEPKV